MQVFKAAMRIVCRNPVYILVYVVGLSLMGVAMASSFSANEADVFERPRVDYAVIDRDDSSVSRGVEEFLATQGDSVQVEDDKLAMQDAVAKGEVDYMLVIPDGFGRDFVEAARTGKDSPKMDVVYSYYATEGALADTEVTNYLGLLRTYAVIHPSASDDALVEDALSASEERVSVDVVKSPGSVSESDTYAFYLQFGAYGLFASIIACVGMLITTFNRASVRRRNLSSPTSYGSYNAQMTLACLVLTALVWAWFFVLGIVCFPSSIAATSTLGLVLEGCCLFTFALVPLGVAFLVGQLGLGAGATNAIGNIAGLVVSFLGGAWVSLDLVPVEVATVAHFLPGYWFTSSTTAAAHITDAAWGSIAPILGGMGVLILFAVAFFLAGLVVARLRVQTDEGGGNDLAPTPTT